MSTRTGFIITPDASTICSKAGGIWVSPVEIEHTLRTHQAVYECCVMGYPDRDDLVKPKAFVSSAARLHAVGRAGD